jgi:hypothetical protein
MSTARLPEHAELPPPKVEEVSESIFAYIQLDGSWGLSAPTPVAAGGPTRRRADREGAIAILASRPPAPRAAGGPP